MCCLGKMVHIEDIVLVKIKKIKIRCDFCGSCIYKHNRASHIRTEMCKSVRYAMCERFGIDGIQLTGIGSFGCVNGNDSDCDSD